MHHFVCCPWGRLAIDSSSLSLSSVGGFELGSRKLTVFPENSELGEGDGSRGAHARIQLVDGAADEVGGVGRLDGAQPARRVKGRDGEGEGQTGVAGRCLQGEPSDVGHAHVVAHYIPTGWRQQKNG